MKTVSVLTSVDHPITIFWLCKEKFLNLQDLFQICFSVTETQKNL